MLLLIVDGLECSRITRDLIEVFNHSLFSVDHLKIGRVENHHLVTLLRLGNNMNGMVFDDLLLEKLELLLFLELLYSLWSKLLICELNHFQRLYLSSDYRNPKIIVFIISQSCLNLSVLG
jgi:hypothetical protein